MIIHFFSIDVPKMPADQLAVFWITMRKSYKFICFCSHIPDIQIRLPTYHIQLQANLQVTKYRFFSLIYKQKHYKHIYLCIYHIYEIHPLDIYRNHHNYRRICPWTILWYICIKIETMGIDVATFCRKRINQDMN